MPEVFSESGSNANMPVKLPVRAASEAPEMIPSAGSTEPSIVDSIPLKLVLMLAAPYLAGQTASDAMKLAHRIYHDNRFSSTLDILGEDSQDVEDCEQAVTSYKKLIDEMTADPLACINQVEQMTVSLKPSMFSVGPPPAGGGHDPKLDDAYERIRSIVDYAFQKNVGVTIEAEDHRWTDFHLETYLALIEAGYLNAGTVLQSRLFRTGDDVRRFDERMRCRLVIGIYNEPATIAHTEKPVMKDLLVEYAGQLSARGTYVELATHDTSCLDRFIERVAIPQRLPASRFETQFLLGVPRRKLQQSLVSGTYLEGRLEGRSQREREYIQELINSGILVRLYLPFGKDRTAAAYCKRRLKANPNMIGYGLKNLLHIQ